MELKTIALFGKPLFNLVTMEHPMKMATPMPEDEAGFVYVLKGGCVNYSETEELILVQNEAVLAKSGNSTFSTVAHNGQSTYKALVIKFHKDVLEKLYQGSTSPLVNNFGSGLSVNSTKVKSNAIIEQYVNGLLTYFDHPELINEDLLKIKLNELITILLQSGSTPEVLGIMAHLFEQKTFEFKEVIKAHVCSSLSIEELAQLTNHSLSAFKKRFKEVYNDTPNNFLIKKRIERVAELLNSTDESLTNIAYDCEFKTLAHMSRVFKSNFGLAPSEYRLNFSDKQ